MTDNTQIQLIQGDCLKVMQDIPDGSIDMVLTDPPFGTIKCKWDSIIPFDPMWKQLKRIVKPNGAIVLFGSQPFTSVLACSNLKMFRYCWIWEKNTPSGFNFCRYQPMRQHEDILVFYRKAPHYDSWGDPYDKPIQYKPAGYPSDSSHMTHSMDRDTTLTATHKRKRSILKFAKVPNGKNVHPTQKPVALMEYLIKTYTKEGDTVLDFTMGSGTTGVACKQESRNFIGIELDADYFQIAKDRINTTTTDNYHNGSQ